MANELDAERLIEEVKKYPELWDVSSEQFQNRIAKRKAWLNVCRGINEDFDRMSKEEQEKICYLYIRKWRNIKDSYWRSAKKSVQSERFGILVRPYVYASLLSFLRPDVEVINETNETQSSLEVTDDDVDVKPDITSETVLPKKPKPVRLVEKKKRKGSAFAGFMASLPSPTISSSTISSAASSANTASANTTSANTHSAPASDSDPDRSFFESILPSIRDFDEDTKLEFRCEILNLIKRMRCNQNNIFI